MAEQNKENPLISFYIVYAQDKAHKPCHEEIKRAASCKNAICFPNQLMDIVVLHQANALEETALAHYYLGNLFTIKGNMSWRAAIGLLQNALTQNSRR